MTWFNEGGISRVDGVRWTLFDSGDGLASGTISMIGEHTTGRKWFGSFGNGRHRLISLPAVVLASALWRSTQD